MAVNKKVALVLIFISLHLTYTLYTMCSREHKATFIDSVVPPWIHLQHNNESPDRIQTLRNITMDITKMKTEAPSDKPLTNKFLNVSYLEAIKMVAMDNTVVLALIDGGFLDMAINFYITCLKSFDVENYLLIGTDQRTCDAVLIRGMNCYVYRQDGDSQSASQYQSKAFLRKMNIRTDMILDALHAGYKVLHTDIDMYCFKHPVKSIDCKMGKCDIAALQDTFAYNAGFLFIQPTQGSINVYERMQAIAKASPKIDDQKQLNTAIKEQSKKNRKFHAVKLDKKQYLCGKYYYEDAKRYFADESTPCKECIVAHNNWIVSMEAKVYRQKEMQQWLYDGEDGYYTSPKRLYISYANPAFNIKDKRRDIELQALYSALAIGRILNRTVILPKFHDSEGKSCTLLNHVMLTPFDKVFGDAYRESTFLSNPLVPESVKQSTIGPFVIQSKFVIDHFNFLNITPFEPHRAEDGMTEREILLHFGDVSQSVIHFSTLYGAFDSFESETEQKQFTKATQEAFKKGNYRQYS